MERQQSGYWVGTRQPQAVGGSRSSPGQVRTRTQAGVGCTMVHVCRTVGRPGPWACRQSQPPLLACSAQLLPLLHNKLAFSTRIAACHTHVQSS